MDDSIQVQTWVGYQYQVLISMQRVAKNTAGFKWLISVSAKVLFGCDKAKQFEKTASNLSSSCVVGLLHGLFKVILLTLPINFQRVSEQLCVCHAICRQCCSVQTPAQQPHTKHVCIPYFTLLINIWSFRYSSCFEVPYFTNLKLIYVK